MVRYRRELSFTNRVGYNPWNVAPCVQRSGREVFVAVNCLTFLSLVAAVSVVGGIWDKDEGCLLLHGDLDLNNKNVADKPGCAYQNTGK